MNTQIEEVIKLPGNKVVDVKEFIVSFDTAIALGNGYKITFLKDDIELVDVKYDRLGILEVIYKYKYDTIQKTISRYGAGYAVELKQLNYEEWK